MASSPSSVSLRQCFAAALLLLPLAGCSVSPAKIETSAGYGQPATPVQIEAARQKFLDAVINLAAYEPQNVVQALDGILPQYHGKEARLMMRFRNCIVESTRQEPETRVAYVRSCTKLDEPFR